MGSIMSAIRDDIAEYEALCKHYGEEVQYKHSSPDCYGKHADALKERWGAEREAAAGPQTRFDRKDPV